MQNLDVTVVWTIQANYSVCVCEPVSRLSTGGASVSPTIYVEICSGSYEPIVIRPQVYGCWRWRKKTSQTIIWLCNLCRIRCIGSKSSSRRSFDRTRPIITVHRRLRVSKTEAIRQSDRTAGTLCFAHYLLYICSSTNYGRRISFFCRLPTIKPKKQTNANRSRHVVSTVIRTDRADFIETRR